MGSGGKFFAGAIRAGRKLAGDEAGSPAVEFALVFPIFIAVVLATLQAGSIFLVKAFFESGAEQAARVVLTNQTAALTAAQFHTEICTQLTALFNCGQVTVELEPMPTGTTNLTAMLPTFDSHGNVVGKPTLDVGATAGAAGSDMLLVVMYPWPVYGGPLGLNFSNMGNGKMLMTSTQVFRIEPLWSEMKTMIRISRFPRRSRAFVADAKGLAAVELALILPVALMLMSLVVFGGQAYSVQRKVTLAATTVANIFAQANNINTSTITAAELNQILAYPNLILYPLQREHRVSRSVASAGHGQRRAGLRPARSAAAGPMQMERPGRRANRYRSIRRFPRPLRVRAPTTIATRANLNYVVLGEVSYPFQPTGIYFSVASMTLHNSIIMIPRVASPITVL